VINKRKAKKKRKQERKKAANTAGERRTTKGAKTLKIGKKQSCSKKPEEKSTEEC